MASSNDPRSGSPGAPQPPANPQSGDVNVPQPPPVEPPPPVQGADSNNPPGPPPSGGPTGVAQGNDPDESEDDLVMDGRITPGSGFVVASKRFDPKVRGAQLLEHWRYTDKEFEDFGYL